MSVMQNHTSVQNQDAQRADMLAHRALLVHDKYIFLLQFLVSRQVFRDDKRHREGLLIQNTFIIKVSPAKSNKKALPVQNRECGGAYRLFVLDVVDQVLHDVALQNVHLDVVLTVGGDILARVGGAVVAAKVSAHGGGVALEARFLGHGLHQQGLLGDGLDAVVGISGV